MMFKVTPLEGLFWTPYSSLCLFKDTLCLS